jgi:hypothetical protein
MAELVYGRIGIWPNCLESPITGGIMKDKRKNNDLQNITHKTKDRVTRTPQKPGGDLMCFGRVISLANK